MTLTHFPKKKFLKIHDHISRKKVWIFFPEMTLTHFPKSNFWNFGWIFFQEWRLLISRLLDFFFQDSRIGVKTSRGKNGHKNLNSSRKSHIRVEKFDTSFWPFKSQIESESSWTMTKFLKLLKPLHLAGIISAYFETSKFKT